MNPTRHTVAIAGAGPVGLMLAGELSAAGVPTVVIERLGAARPDVPGMAINPTVVELLEQRGLMDALREDGVALPHAFFAHLVLDPARLRQQRPLNFMVRQATLEQRLAEYAVKSGAEIRRGHEIIGVEQDDSGVTVQVRTAGGEDTVRCRYLVGCDGVDSSVRQLAGIGFPGAETPFYGILGDVDASEELYGHLGARQYPDGLFTVAPSGPGTMRVTVGVFDVEPPDRERPPSIAEFREQIRRVSGLDVALGDAHWLSRWFQVDRQAETYRRGDVFLAGDAAHVNFPLGGLSLSTGIEDAVNLGWKLAGVIRGWAPDRLLDTYQGERYPVAERARAIIAAQTALMQPGGRAEPMRDLLAELIVFDDVNEHLVKAVGGLDVRYDLPGTAGHPLVGHRLADIPLATAGGSTSTAALLHGGRGVLLDLCGGALVDEMGSGWQERVDGVVAEPATVVGAAGLLLRPDGRVAWATRDREAVGLREALDRWFGPAGQ
ncbi:FAD-dependent oxidoreductase [Micromonospora eburnea]|uniref:3-(3-hydroxy-phenyl)propionate hydroxylase n=1 Tax=Micromonospora eburnea TaxID=227316 RepID=A0A1C6V0P2_9ACTN|nr:FAD-dependent oxidoreductase [Micromonospora eburnea]SCL59868.1 3-(3-hydroxy-phenyl)propionate hydroxylase [Micromonospora eburnea]